ncbi:MAG: hypothetical protein IPG28_01190 [Betaproteobacteria bacterium]|nr:hypothetical protein [Betaproteobacteria bacterium]
MRRLFRLGLCLLLATVPARAANLPPGFTESQFGGVGANIANGTAMAFAPDGRLFVGQQSGALRVIRNGPADDSLRHDSGGFHWRARRWSSGFPVTPNVRLDAPASRASPSKPQLESII